MRSQRQKGDPLLAACLEEQARQLAVPIEYISVENRSRSPERDALRWYQRDGWEGASSEGLAVLTIFHAACLDYLAQINTLGGRDDACIRYFEGQCTIHRDKSDEIKRAILEATEDTLRHNLGEILTHPQSWERYLGMSPNSLATIWRELTPDLIKGILNRFFEDPYSYRNGWPDLTIARHKELRFVEVKTSDKLHASQLRWIQMIGQPLKLHIGIAVLDAKICQGQAAQIDRGQA